MRASPTDALVGGVDGDHVDLARADGVLVDQPDSDEPHRATVGDGDPDVVLRGRAGGADGVGLRRAPIREQQAVDLRAQRRLEACEDRSPRAEREGDHRLEVSGFQRADEIGHPT
jgi:hypothetical protein